MEKFLTPELTGQLLNIAVTIIVSVLGAFATLIAAKLNSYVKAKTTEQQQETLEYIATQGVRYAEQMYKDLGGEEKFDKAYTFVAEVLKQRGINVNASIIEAVIESAVMNEFTKFKLPAEEGAQVTPQFTVTAGNNNVG